MRIAAVLLAFLLGLSPAAGAETVSVFAAASLREVMDALGREFEKATGHRVVVVYAASNALARQIEAGAPADVFVSADAEWADYVESRGLARAGSRRDVAGNELVLVAPAKSAPTRLRIGPGFPLAKALGPGRLAVANPDAVPAGKYAKTALATLGIWDSVKGRLAPAENVRTALAFVATGEAPFGIVYRSDAVSERGVRVVDTFPPAVHPPIVYPLLVLKNAKPAGVDFAAHVAGSVSRRTWERFGFTLDTR
jgi:molybdate transport system substrate-binding protein